MTSPPPFTTDDCARRLGRAAAQSAAADLTGLLVTPGPDLVYFTGYVPTAVTERITLLVIAPDRDPALLVPVLERPDAEAAPGAAALFGVRIEDIVAATDDGARRLNTSSRELRIVA
jgi:Xaa-Pro aminopeptidase